MKKISGGKYHAMRKKKLYERHSPARLTTLGAKKVKALKQKGGEIKRVLLATDHAFVLDQKTKKGKKVKIKAVLQIPSNRYLKNVLMKGAIIDTEMGKARITNRPGQEGNIFAVLTN